MLPHTSKCTDTDPEIFLVRTAGRVLENDTQLLTANATSLTLPREERAKKKEKRKKRKLGRTE